MNLKQSLKKITAVLLAIILVIGPESILVPVQADGALVLTLGADLSEEQKQGMLDFFNIKESDAMVITVTNADEHKLLAEQYTEAQIGSKTFSCALVNPTTSGGIQVKTANLNVVTSGRIASILSTSGVTDCEVIAAAPFMVSGTGALTGVMMGYENALGTTLDPELQRMAIEESTTVSQIGETIGQNEATLVVNDIKIRIIRDDVKDTPQIIAAVDTTIDEVEGQLEQLAAVSGRPAPEKLDQQEHELLYGYGEKLSAMDYNYDSMKLTLQRVTTNTAREIGIEDPIIETFEDLSAQDVLPSNSILRDTNDESMGENANITATDTAALEVIEEPAPEILEEPEPEILEEPELKPVSVELPESSLVTGLRLNQVGSVDGNGDVVDNTSLLQLEFDSGNALADLSGNLLTEKKYYRFESAQHGHIKAALEAGDLLAYGVVSQNGQSVVPCLYEEVEIQNPHWVSGLHFTKASKNDYDYMGMFSNTYYQISKADIYYVDEGEGTLVHSLSRQEYRRAVAMENYLNIEDRDGSVTTYDSSFNVVASNVSSPYDFSHIQPEPYQAWSDRNAEYRYGIKDEDGNIVLQPFADWIARIYDPYVMFAMLKNPDGFEYYYGLAALDGSILLPGVFDRIFYVDNNFINEVPIDDEGSVTCSFDCRGYFCTIQDGVYRFATVGGEITCDTGIAEDDINAYKMPLCLRAKSDNITLYAADGQITRLDETYTSCYPVNHSMGLLWSAEKEKGADLLDWHGNVLLPDIYSARLSGDGFYLAVKEDWKSPIDIYAMTYLYDDGQEISIETAGKDDQPAEEAAEAGQDSAEEEDTAESVQDDAPAEETAESVQDNSEEEDTAESVQDNSPAEDAAQTDVASLIDMLEKTISTVQSTDFEANTEQIAQILEKEKTLVENVNADAAGLLDKAISFIRSGLSDADTTIALLESAIARLG